MDDELLTRRDKVLPAAICVSLLSYGLMSS